MKMTIDAASSVRTKLAKRLKRKKPMAELPRPAGQVLMMAQSGQAAAGART
ncbi:MAG: hypothetical protein M3R22_00645 [Pseudomonadota bacterium]|nr:hypothetical protein [Pseudomonadota bacterium]